MPKAGIYDPYIDSFGGGERYCLTVAESLIKLGYDVDIFWSGDPSIITRAKERFNLDIDRINLVPDPFRLHPSHIEYVENAEGMMSTTSRTEEAHTPFSRLSLFWNKVKVTSSYDLLFYISDWSIPFLFSKNNLLHVQVPLITRYSLKDRFLNYLKLKLIKNVICNSHFTQKIALDAFGGKCEVLYPPIDIEKLDSSVKSRQRSILSVGRFDDILNIKKQDVMIEAFKRLSNSSKELPLRLILAGASLESPEKNSYLKHLRAKAEGYAVDFIVNPSFSELKNLYSTSLIYWHAAGFEVDESIHPEHTEHFGMAPVEAMASGTVPVVVAKGGLPEIVTDGVNGYLWSDLDTLISKTSLLLSDNTKWQQLSEAAQATSQQFSKSEFTNELRKYLKNA